MTASTNFLDILAGIFTSAIAAVQSNAQLTAQNAQLTSQVAQLQSQLAAITSSLNADEQQKADEATKLATLQQLVNQYQSATSTNDPSASVPATPVAA